MSNKISPYIYPGLKIEMLDVSEHPYLLNLKDRMSEDQIIKIVLEKFKIPHERMVSKERKRELVDVRLIISYILRKKCRSTFVHIGHKIDEKVSYSFIGISTDKHSGTITTQSGARLSFV